MRSSVGERGLQIPILVMVGESVRRVERQGCGVVPHGLEVGLVGPAVHGPRERRVDDASPESLAASLGHDLDRGHAGPLAGHHDPADRDRRLADRDEPDRGRPLQHLSGDSRILDPRVEAQPGLVDRWRHPGLTVGAVLAREVGDLHDRTGTRPGARPPAGIQERALVVRPDHHLGAGSRAVLVVERDDRGQRVLELHAGIAVHGDRVRPAGEPAGRPQLPLTERFADDGRPPARRDARQLVGAEGRRRAGPSWPVRHDLPRDDVGQGHPGQAAVTTLDGRLALGDLDQPTHHVGHRRAAARSATVDGVPHHDAASARVPVDGHDGSLSRSRRAGGRAVWELWESTWWT